MLIKENLNSWCNSLTSHSRFETREVRIGNLILGGAQPIRVQSMTTTDTMDTEATVAQSIRMIDAGCELVRITAPSLREAENLRVIKAELKKRGYDTPLIADIHFTPNAAELAARIVEKVRVNPGNYVDKKKFQVMEYSDAEYNAELDRIRQRFVPLVKICKEYGTAMRLGANHGSLSDRIMNRYGDSPLGMVESALEFVRICREFDYHELVLSMKASNPQVMVHAYRLLVEKMRAEGMNYPLHLGVTEAGEGEDGRIKSALGIGSLLEDGIGDTIRVSLTEEPEFEIPVAKTLVNRYSNRAGHTPLADADFSGINFHEYEKRKSREVLNIGAGNVPRVVADISQEKEITPGTLYHLGYSYSAEADKWNLSDMALDFVYTGAKSLDFEIPGTLGVIMDYPAWAALDGKDRTYPILSFEQYQSGGKRSAELNFLLVQASDINVGFIQSVGKDASLVLVIHTNNAHAMADIRRAFAVLISEGCNIPVIIRRDYSELPHVDFQLYAATDAGALLLDGLGDGIWISNHGNTSLRLCNGTAFGILQAARTRISKTEYISCPSCGRTLFDLQQTTARIRSRTEHLKGLKIGIMGCIVNGPGEMADADYGYVGTGPGKITLYKGMEVVKRNVESEHAVDALIDLIRSHGDWVEPG